MRVTFASHLDRRHLLRRAGAVLALPFLEAASSSPTVPARLANPVRALTEPTPYQGSLRVNESYAVQASLGNESLTIKRMVKPYNPGSEHHGLIMVTFERNVSGDSRGVQTVTENEFRRLIV